MYFRESGANPEQFRCCIQGGDIHYATGRSIYSYSGKADIAYDLWVRRPAYRQSHNSHCENNWLLFFMQTQVSVPFLQIMTESSNHFMRKEKENENEEKKISVTHTYACNACVYTCNEWMWNRKEIRWRGQLWWRTCIRPFNGITVCQAVLCRLLQGWLQTHHNN